MTFLWEEKLLCQNVGSVERSSRETKVIVHLIMKGGIKKKVR